MYMYRKISEYLEKRNEFQNEPLNDTQKRDPLTEKIIAVIKANPKATRADIANQAGVTRNPCSNRSSSIQMQIRIE